MEHLDLNAFVRQGARDIPDFPMLVMILRAFEERYGHHGALLIARKAGDLLEIVETLLAYERFPIVDKKSGCVFGLGRKHEHFRAMLFGYCDPADAAHRTWDDRAARYITQGHGYYISSMDPRVLICGVVHREDEHDRLLFETMQLKCLD
jgi:hypothetical protein